MACGDAAQDAARVVGFETRGGEFVAVVAAALCHHIKAVANFHTFHRIDAHHRVGDVGIQAVKHGLAEAYGYVAGADGELGTNRVQRLADAVHIRFKLVDLAVIGSEKWVVVDVFFAFKSDVFFAHLGDMADDFGAKLFTQPFFGDCPCGNTGGGFTR